MPKPPIIPPQQRHDAPDPDRPYIALSPLVSVTLYVVMASVVMLYFSLGFFYVLAAFAALVAGVASTPDLLRGRSVTWMERHLSKLAKRRRARRLRRWQRIDRAFLGVGRALEATAGSGLFILLAAGVAAATGNSAATLIQLGLALLALAGLLGLVTIVAATLHAQWKGDYATGPMHFHKVASVAAWLESHPESAKDLQLWSFILAVVLTIVGVLTSV